MRQAVDLVDEEDLPALEIGEDRRQVARPLQDRSGGAAHGRAQLGPDDVRQRRLPESRRAAEQHVIEHVAARARRRDLHAQVLADVILPDVLLERARTERRLDEEVVLERLADDRAAWTLGHRHPARPWSAARITSSSDSPLRITRCTARSASGRR